MWNQSVVNEKVYTLSLLSVALVLWLILRWDDQPLGEAHDHHLLLIVYLIALTATNHMMGVLVGPVVVVLLFPPLRSVRPVDEASRRVEWSQWFVFCSVYGMIVATGLESATPLFAVGVLFLAAFANAILRARNWDFAVAVLAVAVVGLSVYLFLPIRAAHYPPINEGEPTTWKALWEVLTRQQYGKPPVSQRQASLVAQIGMWVQYFSWQWGRDWMGGLQRGLAVVFASLGLLGAWRHWKADRRAALAMTALMATFTLLLIFYLNFKYGFSQMLDRPQLAREVRERDYFFITSFALWGVWVGMGLATLMEWAAEWLEQREPDRERRWRYATPLLLLALIPLAGNRLTASRAGETLARDFAFDILQSAEPYGVLVTAGDNDTFPLWYAQEVEGIRKDVTVVNLSLANTDWYLRQLQRRPLADFEPDKAPALYRGRQWPKPTGRLLNFSDAQLDGLQPVYFLEQKTTVNLGGVGVTLDPAQLNRQYLEKADVIVLQAIRDQLGKRPIYFSRTVGPYADQFGLTGYLEGQGFVRKLHQEALAESDSIKAVPGLGYVNVPRTEALAFQVYHRAAAARNRPRGWVDRPSEGILATYGIVYQALAQVLQKRNQHHLRIHAADGAVRARRARNALTCRARGTPIHCGGRSGERCTWARARAVPRRLGSAVPVCGRHGTVTYQRGCALLRQRVTRLDGRLSRGRTDRGGHRAARRGRAHFRQVAVRRTAVPRQERPRSPNDRPDARRRVSRDRERAACGPRPTRHDRAGAHRDRHARVGRPVRRR
ncbi:MAG: hypothetical protein AUH12_08330 [Gemmatimonadetes bacterium 13_2_20CM_69_8]|nr:MAG: hypothetical protein AUH12_08330 [Gemmatimonadetes bacterium 13_2_20CM_69_8]